MEGLFGGLQREELDGLHHHTSSVRFLIHESALEAFLVLREECAWIQLLIHFSGVAQVHLIGVLVIGVQGGAIVDDGVLVQHEPELLAFHFHVPFLLHIQFVLGVLQSAGEIGFEAVPSLGFGDEFIQHRFAARIVLSVHAQRQYHGTNGEQQGPFHGCKANSGPGRQTTCRSPKSQRPAPLDHAIRPSLVPVRVGLHEGLVLLTTQHGAPAFLGTAAAGPGLE